MTKVGTLSAGTKKLETVFIGNLRWKAPGLKLIRIESKVSKQRIIIDRIRLIESDEADN